VDPSQSSPSYYLAKDCLSKKCLSNKLDNNQTHLIDLNQIITDEGKKKREDLKIHYSNVAMSTER
jgi:hypothetical protein